MNPHDRSPFDLDIAMKCSRRGGRMIWSRKLYTHDFLKITRRQAIDYAPLGPSYKAIDERLTRPRGPEVVQLLDSGDVAWISSAGCEMSGWVLVQKTGKRNGKGQPHIKTLSRDTSDSGPWITLSWSKRGPQHAGSLFPGMWNMC